MVVKYIESIFNNKETISNEDAIAALDYDTYDTYAINNKEMLKEVYDSFGFETEIDDGRTEQEKLGDLQSNEFTKEKWDEDIAQMMEINGLNFDSEEWSKEMPKLEGSETDL